MPDSFDFYESCGYDYRYYNWSTLLAFDQDGKLVRGTIFPAFENADFPFYAGSMEEETLSQLIGLYGWNYWNFCTNEGRIYTLQKRVRQPTCDSGFVYNKLYLNK